MRNPTEIKATLWLLILAAFLLSIAAVVVHERTKTIQESYFVTFDTEGDYLIWDSEPENQKGLWMPTNDNFTCTPVSKESLKVIIEDFKAADYSLKHGFYIRIKKHEL